MKSFYVTLPKSKANKILKGKLRLADVELPRCDSEGFPDSVELHDELNPPLNPDKQVVLKIVVSKPKAEWKPCLIPIEDTPDNAYAIPRSWLDDATCKIMPDAEILEHCKEHLHWIGMPTGPLFWMRIEECVNSGKTENLSPFYIQAYQEFLKENVIPEPK